MSYAVEDVWRREQAVSFLASNRCIGPPEGGLRMDRLAQENALLVQENAELQQQISKLQQEEKRLTGSLQHYRAWSATLQSRFQQSRYHADALKPPRRIYVGSLPADITDADLRQFINHLMTDRGATIYRGSPVTACKVYPEKSYAFVEFRNVEEASNLMAFDGLIFRNCYLRIRRPNNYDFSWAERLGPTDPNPTIDLSDLDMVKTIVQDSPNKLFIGGLPCEWPEDQVKGELTPFGRLMAFNLVMDKNTGYSKGYAFCEYLDPNVTDIVISELNLRSIDRRTLTVKRACVPPDPAQPAQVQAPSPSQQPRQAQPSAADPEGLPTQAMLQAQHSVTQGLPQSQPSMQSVTQGLHQAQLGMQSMTLGMPQRQHSMQSMAQGGPPYQHSMQSMTQGLPQMSYAASPQGMQHPQVRAGTPMMSSQGSMPSPGMQVRGFRPPQSGFYLQQRYPRDGPGPSRPSSSRQ